MRNAASTSTSRSIHATIERLLHGPHAVVHHRRTGTVSQSSAVFGLGRSLGIVTTAQGAFARLIRERPPLCVSPRAEQ